MYNDNLTVDQRYQLIRYSYAIHIEHQVKSEPGTGGQNAPTSATAAPTTPAYGGATPKREPVASDEVNGQSEPAVAAGGGTITAEHQGIKRQPTTTTNPACQQVLRNIVTQVDPSDMRPLATADNYIRAHTTL